MLLSVSDFFLSFKSQASCSDPFDQSLPVIILTIFFSVVLCRMKMYEMRKGGRYGIGFIDPNTVNEYTWRINRHHQKDVEDNMLEFLKRLKYNEDILLPYNFP